jgi:hypothetical protein
MSDVLSAAFDIPEPSEPPENPTKAGSKSRSSGRKRRPKKKHAEVIPPLNQEEDDVPDVRTQPFCTELLPDEMGSSSPDKVIKKTRPRTRKKKGGASELKVDRNGGSPRLTQPFVTTPKKRKDYCPIHPNVRTIEYEYCCW